MEIIHTKSQHEKRESFLRRNGSFILFLAAMALMGFLAQIQWIGYIVIACYAVYALIKKMAARTTFILALLTLGVVPVAIVLSNWLVAQNFAAYTFVLLVFGMIGLVLDLQREVRVKK